MYGASSTVGRLWYNQSAAACGNTVGGAIFIGLMVHAMNHWRSPIFTDHTAACGELLGHDVESTRRAQSSMDRCRHVDSQQRSQNVAVEADGHVAEPEKAVV